VFIAVHRSADVEARLDDNVLTFLDNVATLVLICPRPKSPLSLLEKFPYLSFFDTAMLC